MTTLHRLIKGQTIRIDNHNRANGVKNSFDQSVDIHIHKSKNSSKKQKASIDLLIPLKPQGKSYTESFDSFVKNPNKNKIKAIHNLYKEVRDILLSNSKKFSDFIEEINESLNKDWGCTEDMKEKILPVIGGYFDLPKEYCELEELLKIQSNFDNSQCRKFVSLFSDANEAFFVSLVININTKQYELTIGQFDYSIFF